jgi:hypothetical protein
MYLKQANDVHNDLITSVINQDRQNRISGSGEKDKPFGISLENHYFNFVNKQYSKKSYWNTLRR